MITEMVYLGRDNVNALLVSEDGQATDLDGVTRIVMNFEGSGVQIDSNLSNEYISWSGNTIELRLGSLDIPPGKYPTTLVAYDADHDDGQVLFHAIESSVLFWFVAP